MRQDGDTNGNMTDDGTARLTVRDAADALGISTEAARQRIKRGTLPTERDPDGTVWVLVAADNTDTNYRTNSDRTRTNDRTDGNGTADQALLMAHLDSLQEQIEFMRHELERKDHLLAAALERIPPQLEAPQKPSEARQGDAPDVGVGSDHTADNGTEPRSWLSRFFFGP